jgi:protein disulfide-isomerase
MKFFFALCCFLTTAMIVPGLAAGEWFTDFEKAKAESLRTKRPIYILFTKSDAAADRSLDRTIFSQRKFQEYADKSLVLMKVDFPTAIHLQPKRLQQQNRDLRTKFGISILPTALLLNANGELYKNFVKEDGGMEKHRKKINEIMDFNAPQRYADYVDVLVKKYKAPEPPPAEKKPKAKQNTATAQNTAASQPPAGEAQNPPAADQKQDAKVSETSIPDENASLLIPLNPEGDFQEWLKSGLAEGAAVEAKEAETAKATVEQEKEAIEESESKEAAQQPAPSPAEE